MSLDACTRLGPYEIIGLIGAGGMGEVYQARDTRLDRTVAIKVLPSDISADPDRRARFEKEAKTIATLSHPHICTLHDVGEHAGTMFLVMEHLKGETLAQRLERGAVPIEDVLTIATEIAGALSAAHRQGIIHRDLKPGNVMLTRSGAKLLDFGLAKLTLHGHAGGVSHLASGPTRSAPLTAEGVIVGTLQYMAPEQIEGKAADARTDLWAFGALVHEMVTGKRVFEAGNAASLIAAILEREPAPLITLQPLTPVWLDRLTRQCLSRAPDDRPDTAHDVANQLRWLRESRDAGALGSGRPAAMSSIVRSAALVLVVVAVLGAGLASWLWTGPRRLESPARFRIDPPGGHLLASGAGTAGIALSPDGRLLAFAAYDPDVAGRSTHPNAVGGAMNLFVRAMDELEPRLIAGTTDARRPFFSPDGRWIGFWQDGKIRKVSVEGTGPVITMAEAPLRGGAIWTADNHIIYGDGVGIARVSSDPGVSAVRIASAGPGTELRDPFLLPDRKTVLVAAGPASATDWSGEIDIRLISLATGEIRSLGVKGQRPQFLPPGILLYVGADGWLYRIGFDARRSVVTGTAEPVLHTLRGRVAIAPAGTMAYLRSTVTDSSHLEWVSRDGNGAPLYPEWSGSFNSPRLSPDGKYLAGRSEQNGIWIRPLPDGPLTWLARRQGNSTRVLHRPGWRDSSTVLFHTSGTVFQRDIGAMRDAVVLLQDPRLIVESLWSPDRRWLIYRTDSQSPGRGDIMAREWDTETGPVSLAATPAEEVSPVLSPDGRWLAYVSDETGQREVYAQSFAPGADDRVRISTDGGTEPVWARSGRELFYRDARRDLISIEVRTGPAFSTGARRRLFSTAPYKADGLSANYDVSLDGRHFVLVRDRRIESVELILVRDVGAALGGR